MTTQKFGIEIETTGLGRKAAAQTIASIIGGHTKFIGGTYDTWVAIGPDGRNWKAMSDSSVTGARTGSTGMHGTGGNMAEIVSPICTWADIDTIQAIARALRQAGATTDNSCGIHIHIGAEGFDAKGLTRLVKMVKAKESLMIEAFGISPTRLGHWCKPIDTQFFDRLMRQKPQTLEQFAATWYDDRHYSSMATDHYDSSRYHILNLHATFQKGQIDFDTGRIRKLGTIEFRAFNGTLHAGKIKAYIQFCMALVAKAKAAKSATASDRTESNKKFAMRTWLLRLGFIGEEFATARKHLTDLLPGDSAWADNRRLSH